MDPSHFLMQALQLAQEAVRLDNALDLRGAYEAYWQSVFLIRQVLDVLRAEASDADYSSDSSDSDDEGYHSGPGIDTLLSIERLTQIHNQYQERMELLASRMQWSPSSSLASVPTTTTMSSSSSTDKFVTVRL